MLGGGEGVGKLYSVGSWGVCTKLWKSNRESRVGGSKLRGTHGGITRLPPRRRMGTWVHTIHACTCVRMSHSRGSVRSASHADTLCLPGLSAPRTPYYRTRRDRTAARRKPGRREEGRKKERSLAVGTLSAGRFSPPYYPPIVLPDLCVPGDAVESTACRRLSRDVVRCGAYLCGALLAPGTALSPLIPWSASSGETSHPPAGPLAGYSFIHCSPATYLDHGEIQSVSCPPSARWRHVAGSPLPSAQACCPKKM